MTSDAVIQDVENFLKSHPSFAGLLPSPLGHNDSLVRSGALDSVGIFHLIIFLEEKYGFTIDVPEIIEDNFSSLRVIADFVKRKVGARRDAQPG